MKISADIVGGSVEAKEKAEAAAAMRPDAIAGNMANLALGQTTNVAATTLTGTPGVKVASTILQTMEGLKVGTKV
jgi:hypothetical protein